MELIKSLNDKTAILESLDWDEEALTQLIDFIDMQKECFVPTHPNILLEQIREYFGESTSIVMEGIFRREYVFLMEQKNGQENWFKVFLKQK